MAKTKIFTAKTMVLLMLFIFLGSVVGGAIIEGVGRGKVKLPETNIMRNAPSEAEEYAILSQGFVLLKFSVPLDCSFFCQAEVTRIEAIVQKYAPYVFLEELKGGTKMKMDAVTAYGERSVGDVNATAVEDTVCLALPLHPECRRLRALEALQSAGENGTGNFTNISIS